MKASTDAEIVHAPNWEQFYAVLLRMGPSALIGIPESWVEWFRNEGSTSEWFWYEGMAEAFFKNWEESPEFAVEEAFQHYVMSVQAGLRELPVRVLSEGWATCGATGARLTWEESIDAITGELKEWLVQALLTAARAAN